MAGTTGATITPTGMPAAASRSIAFSRSRGCEARGSILRATSPSSVVIESITTAAWCAASSWRMSMSRVTSSFLVMIADRVAELGQHLQAPAGDLQPPLGGLVAVGDAAHRQRLRLPLRGGELLAEQLGGVLLDQDAALEVEPGREAQVLVERAGVAIDAPVLAPPVGIHRGVEPHVRAVVVGDHRPRRVAQQLRLDPLGTRDLLVPLDRRASRTGSADCRSPRAP